MDQKQPLRPPRDRGVRPTAIRLGGSSRATSATSTNAAGTARSPRRHLSQSPTDPGLPDRPVVRPRCARGLQHRPNAHLSPRRGTVKARCPRPLRLCSKSSYIQQQNRDDIAVLQSALETLCSMDAPVVEPAVGCHPRHAPGPIGIDALSVPLRRKSCSTLRSARGQGRRGQRRRKRVRRSRRVQLLRPANIPKDSTPLSVSTGTYYRAAYMILDIELRRGACP